MQLLAPLCTVIAQKDGATPSGNEAITLGLKLAKAATEGNKHCTMLQSYCSCREIFLSSAMLLSLAGRLPSDELLGEVLSFLQPPGFKSKESNLQITIPAEVRKAFDTISGPSTSTLRDTGLLPLMTNSVEILEQVPLLIEEVSCLLAVLQNSEYQKSVEVLTTCKLVLLYARWPMAQETLFLPLIQFEQLLGKRTVQGGR